MNEYRKITRIEKYLAKIIGEDVELPESPIYREEFYLAKIAGETVNVLPTPITRIDKYLAKIAGESVELPTPITRTDYLLAKVAGEDVETPEYPLSEAEKYLLKWAESGGYEETTVEGVSPLILANAAARAIVSLTQYGKCEQASTPTPDAPVGIVCNNGTLKMKHRSGLPDGYRLLEYVGGSGSQYVITDLYLASTDVVECEYRNSSTTGYGAIYGIYKTGDSSALYGNRTYYGYDESNTAVNTDVPVDTAWHSSRHDFINGTLTVDDTTVSFTPWTFTNTTKNALLARHYNGAYGYFWKGDLRKFKVTRGNEVVCDLLPAKNSSNVAGLYDLITGDFYTATGGTLLEGNEVDDYELRVVGTPEVLTIAAASDQRLPQGYTPLEYVENAGTGYIDTGIIMNTADLDVEIDFQPTGDTSGQPKMAWGYMGNSPNLPRWGIGTYQGAWLGSPNGTFSRGTADNGRHTIGGRVYQTASNYTYDGTIDGTSLYPSTSLSNVSLFLDNTLSAYLFARNNNGTAGNNFVGKIYGFKVTKADVVIHELIPCKNDSDVVGFYDIKTHTFMGAIGTLTGEVKYTTIGTATVPDLFAVGDYADSAEIIAGLKNRKIGIKVMTGEETPISGTNGWIFEDAITDNLNATYAVLCTHFKGTTGTPAAGSNTVRVYYTSGGTPRTYFAMDKTVYDTADKAKAYFAEQYAAGTPVIVLYPLAEETTESVTPQPLSTNDGDNTITVTANVDNIELEATYERKVS